MTRFVENPVFAIIFFVLGSESTNGDAAMSIACQCRCHSVGNRSAKLFNGAKNFRRFYRAVGIPESLNKLELELMVCYTAANDDREFPKIRTRSFSTFVYIFIHPSRFRFLLLRRSDSAYSRRATKIARVSKFHERDTSLTNKGSDGGRHEGVDEA